MKLPAITPGPWELHCGNGIVRKCEGDYCQPIADMRPPYAHGIGLVRGEKQQWANAKAIAAVPASLAAALPFATFAEHAVDDDGWIGQSGNERISDWFGPSEFRAVVAALSLAGATGNG